MGRIPYNDSHAHAINSHVLRTLAIVPESLPAHQSSNLTAQLRKHTPMDAIISVLASQRRDSTRHMALRKWLTGAAVAGAVNVHAPDINLAHSCHLCFGHEGVERSAVPPIIDRRCLLVAWLFRCTPTRASPEALRTRPGVRRLAPPRAVHPGAAVDSRLPAGLADAGAGMHMEPDCDHGTGGSHASQRCLGGSQS